jgi:CRISPR-associated endonuclease/helicase Cas3
MAMKKIDIRHTLEPAIDDDILLPANIDFIARKTEEANSTLIVCNHVPTAQQIYHKLKNRIRDIVLLHSRFCRRDRNRIENKLMLKSKLRKLPKVLVATQVIEVSLDLDFDQGFLEPATIDALVQRMGRINRFGKLEQPAKIWIFRNQCNSHKIYDEDLTDRSLNVLSSLSNPLSEEDLNYAADRVYGNGYNHNNQVEYIEGLNHSRLKRFKECLVAGTNQDWIDEVIDEREGSIDLLPEKLVNRYNILKKQGLTIKANDLLVPVGRWRLDYLRKDGKIDNSQDPWVLLNCDYSTETGLEINT